MDTDGFIAEVKLVDIYKDIAEDIEIRFNTSNFEQNRPIQKRKSKKAICIMKDELGEKIMKEKNCAFKRKPKFEDYENFLEATQLENKIFHLEKNTIDVDILKEDHKEFVKIIELILKTQQRLKVKVKVIIFLLQKLIRLL